MLRNLLNLWRLLPALAATTVASAANGQPADLPPPVDGRRVALVIGNSDYADGSGWDDLANAARDARHIADILQNPARGAARFDVELVTDGTREQILARLQAFTQKAAGADIALVYFSGHGFEFNLDNYIVPTDAPGRIDESNVAHYYVNMAEVVRAAGARGFSLFFLDACRDPGPVMRFTDRTDGHRAAMFGAINAPHSVVFYSTALGNVAHDDAPPGSPLSPFAAAVGRAMATPGLDLPYMFARVRERVEQATRGLPPIQIPQFAGSWSRPFYFLPPERTETVLASAARQSATETPRLDIPLTTLSTVDEPILINRVLDAHRPAQLIAMAEAGDPLALYLVGFMFEFGVGVERDHAQARQWLDRAAQTGHPAGQLELGYFLLTRGSPAERPRALELYRQAAAQGYAKALSHLGNALLLGTFGSTDRPEGVRLLREAARLGHPFAHQALAIIDEDRSAHIAALQAAAAAGNDEGHNGLCEIAAMGVAVPSTFAHCLAAARAGFTNARAHVAWLYHQGNGVEASPSDARYWARLALGGYDLRDDLRARIAPLAR